MDRVLQDATLLGYRGYLQIELIVVVVLLGLMAVVPLLKADFSNEVALSQQVQMVVADLRWLQQRSMNIYKGHYLFPQILGDLTPKLYFMKGESSQYFIVEGTKGLKTHKFYGGVQPGASYSSIYFNQDGYINVPITLVLCQGDKSRKIIVDRVGRIRME